MARNAVPACERAAETARLVHHGHDGPRGAANPGKKNTGGEGVPNRPLLTVAGIGRPPFRRRPRCTTPLVRVRTFGAFLRQTCSKVPINLQVPAPRARSGRRSAWAQAACVSIF